MLIHWGCLEEMDKLIEQWVKVDAIITDPPYWTMKNAPSTWDKEKTRWDTTIKSKDIFEKANKLLKNNWRLILFSQEPYSSKLITETSNNIFFNYRAIWKKDTFANHLWCKKGMVNFTEEILIFSKYEECSENYYLQEYFLKEFTKTNLSIKTICELLWTKNASHFFTKWKQFRIPNKETFIKLQNLTWLFNIDYISIKNVNIKNNKTFNLWEGNKYKSNILEYKKDYDWLHPTQKPILLLEDLVKTFSNEWETVLDFCMWSWTTILACQNTNRKWIWIELDENYFNIAKNRL